MTTLPENLMVNLEILSNIQKNGRITRSYNGKIHLENETILQGVKRYITNDSRQQSVHEINSIINECFNIIDHILDSKYTTKTYQNTNEYAKNCENLEFLLTELQNARVGIENLKFTYGEDKNTESELNVIIRKINTKIRDTTQKMIYLKNTASLGAFSSHNITIDTPHTSNSVI